MRIAICDDNMQDIAAIENYINELKTGVTEYDSYMTGESLLNVYRGTKHPYDALFLDMEVEAMNGIDIAAQIRDLDDYVIIIFVSSHTEFVFDSFKCQPFRFLVKPVQRKKFAEAFGAMSTVLLRRPKYVTFTEKNGSVNLCCDDIIYCESSDHMILIHTKENTYRVRKSMPDICNMLDDISFCRVHRSYLINLRHIDRIESNTVELRGADRAIPIGRAYKKEFSVKNTNFLERAFNV